MEEEFRDIEMYVGKYQVSNKGRIKSVERINSHNVKIEEKILKTTITSENREICVFPAIKGGRPKTMQVSKIVACAFPEICGQWFEGCHIHHKDRNPLNNNAENLIIVSKDEHKQIHKGEFKRKGYSFFKYDMEWNVVGYYKTKHDAAVSVNGDPETLLRYAFENKPYKGYYFVKP